MKTKLVLWGQKGTEEAPEKVLLAMELLAENNEVKTLLFEGELASEDLAEQLLNNWRNGEAVAFPAGFQETVAELSAGDSLLPDGIVAIEKEDMLKRTQTEWLFIVLSTKLFKTYESELNELQDRVDSLDKYSKTLWNELKQFQDKVQTQVKEQNLFREHTQLLRERINELFGTMKQLRKIEDEAFEKAAKAAYDAILADLLPIEEAVENDEGQWPKKFDQLKSLQNRLKKAKLTRQMRTELWERIDKAFKDVKTKRFGNQGNADSRLQRRINGLSNAIKKMEHSIARDEKELKFQNKKLNSPNVTQLENQLREVKTKMINERIASKKEKLADMHKTLGELENRLKRMQEKAAKEEAKAKEKAEKKAKEEAAAKEAEKTAAPKEETKAEETKTTEQLEVVAEATPEQEETPETATPPAEEKKEAPKTEAKEETPEPEKAEEKKEETVSEEEKPADKDDTKA